MSNELEILSNDLEIYLRGFQDALGKKDVAEAIRYLNEMKKEVEENLEFLTHVYAPEKPLESDSR
ncbi:MAG: hypothetical protein QXJ74_03965 [Nitrososphaera sp.]|uniref:hypothetical protein n=1 Tax=Nitrososphaera sp. TaxID=1971748 RepID=UPI0017B99B5C|nr:hypothetical protein [Nitrososphaera sp.]NWG38193.1 hypothetical protein [Nitrososphaera sp.]